MRRKVPWPKLITIPWGNTPCAQKCSDFQSKMHCSFKLLIRLTLQISLSQFSIGFLLTPALMRRTIIGSYTNYVGRVKTILIEAKSWVGQCVWLMKQKLKGGEVVKMWIASENLRLPVLTFLRNGNMCTTYVLQFFYVVLFSLKKINTNKET